MKKEIMESIRLTSVRNTHGVKVKRCCASCQHKIIEKDGGRVCGLTMNPVILKYKCKRYQMSDGMKNAGKGGSVVRLKGTQEVVF